MILAAGVWTAVAAVALAEDPDVIRSPGSGDRLRAGDSVAVSWSLDPDASAERDEMELILSLDGGATFPIRVTGELSTTSRSYAWRVPALPSERAVLAMRAGDDGETDSETVLAIGEPFAISADLGAMPEPLYAVAEEWRTRDALEGAPVRTPARDLDSSDPGPGLSPADGDAHESETPPAGAESGRAEALGALARAANRLRPAPPRTVSISAPLPLRL